VNDRIGHICPECGAPRESGGSPTCGCARRAADELLETRSAEAAAAEDFDPLRIRPYVDLEVRTEDSAGPGGTGAPDGENATAVTAEGHEGREGYEGHAGQAGHAGGKAHEGHEGHERVEGGPGNSSTSTGAPGGPAGPDDWGTIAIPEQRTPAAPTDPLDSPGLPEHQGRLEGFGAPRIPGTPGTPGTAGTPGTPDASGAHPADAFAEIDATMQLSRATARPHPDSHPHPAGAQLFEPEPGSDPEFGQQDPASDLADFPDDPAENTSRRRRLVLVGAGATAVVVAAAGFASGLFSYESPSRNSAAPDDIRASVPDASVDEPSPSKPESPSASASTSASESSSASAAPSATESEASASPSRTTETTSGTPSPEASTSTTEPPPTPSGNAEPVILRRGDEGPEVTELQQRLKQLSLFVGDTDGNYNDRTETAVRNYQFTRGLNDNRGTYDQQTRDRLESETSEP